MKLILDNNQLNQAPEMFLRQVGYNYLVDKKTGNESFVRSLNHGYYPRFHLYLEQQNDKIIFNLHLDQKQASYAHAHAHNAEYDGETVQKEIMRIKSFIAPAPQQATINNTDILDKIRSKNFSSVIKKAEKKNWWGKLFS